MMFGLFAPKPKQNTPQVSAAVAADIRKLQTYRKISDKFIRDIIRRDVPWLPRAAGPSTWRAYGKPALPVYVLELDTTQVSASRLTKRNDILHDIKTALGGQISIKWKNHIGLGLVFDARQLVFPDKVDLPAPPENNYLIPFGVDVRGTQIWRSIRETTNIVVAGQTRRGKTSGFRSWLVALTRQHGPDELKLALIDGKDYEFAPLFDGSPYLPGFMNGNVASSLSEVSAVTEHLVKEIFRRRQLFKTHRVSDTAGLAKKAGIRLPVIIVVIDEVRALVDSGLDTRNLDQIARLGAGLDVFIIAGTQRPDADTLSKANYDTIVSYRLANPNEAQVVFTRHAPFYILQHSRPGECVVRGSWTDLLHLKAFWTPGPGQSVDTPAVKKRTVSPPRYSLSKADVILVKVALLRNNGVCSVGKIYRIIQDNLPEKYWQKGGPFTEHRIRTKFARWEEAGLLTSPTRLPDGRKQGRLVTDRLQRLAGMKAGA